MSIVVTCSCTRTYRLPDRYAGKRCRCRECGKKIEVPAHETAAKSDSSAERKKGKKRRSKDDPSRTTRRLSSQDQEILGERRRIRSSHRTRPVSESMHQLAPMNLSGDLPIAPARPKKAKPKAEKPAKTTKTIVKPAPEPAPPKPVKQPKSPKKPKGKKKGRAERAAKTTKLGRAAAKPAPKPARRGRASQEDGEAPRKGYSLQAVLGIAGALCLGIGLVVGGLWAANRSTQAAAAADLDQRLASIRTLETNRAWSEARAAATKLVNELKASGADESSVARVAAVARGADAMAQITALTDDDQKVATLLRYASDRDPGLRYGVAVELAQHADTDEAQRALGGLARDGDPLISTAAREGLIHVGGPRAIPYLAAAIEAGGPIADVALDRALELIEPEAIPALLTALRVRSTSATPERLVQILNRLARIGADLSCEEQLKPFASHADEAVRNAATACLASLH